MTKNAKIKEIFSSIQGEGILIGVKQIFIRFCGCNLNCAYCDTDFDSQNAKEYTVNELLAEIENYSGCHSVSLTGGEPLLYSEFLKEFLPQCQLPVYLETNATLSDNFAEISDYIDYVAADIKLPSCTGLLPYWNEHDKFFSKAKDKNLFAKIVFDDNITDDEIMKSVDLALKYDIEIILQPKFTNNLPESDMDFVEKVMDKFLSKYKKVRLIPQVHKFLNVR